MRPSPGKLRSILQVDGILPSELVPCRPKGGMNDQRSSGQAPFQWRLANGRGNAKGISPNGLRI